MKTILILLLALVALAGGAQTTAKKSDMKTFDKFTDSLHSRPTIDNASFLQKGNTIPGTGLGIVHLDYLTANDATWGVVLRVSPEGNKIIVHFKKSAVTWLNDSTFYVIDPSKKDSAKVVSLRVYDEPTGPVQYSPAIYLRDKTWSVDTSLVPTLGMKVVPSGHTAWGGAVLENSTYEVPNKVYHKSGRYRIVCKAMENIQAYDGRHDFNRRTQCLTLTLPGREVPNLKKGDEAMIVRYEIPRKWKIYAKPYDEVAEPECFDCNSPYYQQYKITVVSISRVKSKSPVKNPVILSIERK